MSLIAMTRTLAFAAGKDAADRQMRKAGRRRWNLEDQNLAARKAYNLFPPCQDGFAEVCACANCRPNGGA